MKPSKVLSFALALVLAFPISSHAYWVWSPEQGKFINPEGAAENTADEAYNRAMKLYKDKNLKEAAEKIQEILKKSPNSKIAPEALYRLGVIYEEMSDYLKAFKQYKKLLESYPSSDRFNEVVEREFRIGNVFFSGKKAKFSGMEILPALPNAAKVFDHIVKTAPYSEYGDKAQFQLGLTYKKMGKFGQSVEAFQGLIDQHPQSELVAQARYQLAETSYQRSAVEVRDQRALDEASKKVDSFLTRYGDSASAEEAAKLRQAIDEKNAQKNYRVGVYYEKENYLDSALIYYADVSKRYPDTVWGKKAAEKLQSLKSPASYLNNQEKEILEEENLLRTQIKAAEKDKEEKERLERKLQRVEQHHKSISKDKKESMERRKQDLARRQRELKEKFKNLDEKKKLLKKNPSEDLKNAIDRWHASLVSEQEDLDKEKIQIKEWRQELGVKERRVDFIPFVGEGPTPLEKVRRIEAKKLYKLSEEKKDLLEEKELLYKHHQEVSSLLGGKGVSAISKKDWKKLVEKDSSLAGQKEKVEVSKTQLEQLDKELGEKTHDYEKKFGKETWLTGSVNAIGKGLDKSFDFVNPFDKKHTAEGGQQALIEQHMHLKEKIAAEQSIVQTLSEAFNAQMALQEQRRLLAGLRGKEGEVSREEILKVRKELKTLEKDIRADYQEIQDRHKAKSKMLDEMDGLLKERTDKNPAAKAGKVATAPLRLGKAFLFGLDQKDVTISREASKLGAESPRIVELKKNIELESLLIEAKSQELVNKQKELEIIKAKASLMGGYKFRPAFVKVPYLFIDEAIQSAKRLVPKKDREDLLINRLNEETAKLEAMKSQLGDLEKKIGKVPAEKAPEKEAPVVQKPAAELKEGQQEMRQEIETLQGKIKSQREAYATEHKSLKERIFNVRKQLKKEETSQAKTARKNVKVEKKFRRELEEIEGSLKDVIEKEQKLEVEESSILEKRIQKIDAVMKKMTSKVLSQDLLTERERMEERLSQIDSRKDFLTKELERFRVAGGGAAKA